MDCSFKEFSLSLPLKVYFGRRGNPGKITLHVDFFLKL
jgi:hypothetical protein